MPDIEKHDKMKNDKRILMIISCYFFLGVLFSQTCLPSGISFTTQQEINNFSNNFPGCETIQGDVLIDGASITNLNGLAQIKTINGRLGIGNNSMLTSLSGLDNIVTIGNVLYILNNSLLVDLNGLNSLGSVGGIVINTNANLLNLNGLQNLITNTASLTILGNQSLSDISQVSNLLEINGFLKIFNNDALSTLVGLENIDPHTIKSQFTGIEDLIIDDNATLSNCSIESICDFLNLSGISSLVQNNMANCNSETQIINICSALPIELIDFSGVTNKNQIKLNWKTASELNNIGFEIQKSANGRNWEIIDFVEGQGTSNEINEYSYQDSNPFSGINYYQLKQIDYDGVFEYSKVIAVEYNNSEKEIQVFPNPSNRLINIQIDNPSNQRMKVKISDNLGRNIWESELIEGESNWRKEMKIDGNGIYFITAQIGNEIFYERVIILNEK